MKQSIGLCQFHDAFRNMNRQDQFTYQGLTALYEFIEQLDDETGSETELDVIALCCEFTEYEDLKEFHKDYSAEDYPNLESIRNNTLVIEVGSESFIIQDF